MSVNDCGAGCSCRSAPLETNARDARGNQNGVGGVDRRRFLAQSATAAVAVALAACGYSTAIPTAPGTLSQKTTVTLSNYPQLANVDGVAYVSDSGGNPIAVVRVSSSSFVALSRICPHAGNIIQSVNGGFYCPGHGAMFSYNGTWEGGQRTSNMTTYPVQYDAAGGTLAIG